MYEVNGYEVRPGQTWTDSQGNLYDIVERSLAGYTHISETLAAHWRGDSAPWHYLTLEESLRGLKPINAEPLRQASATYEVLAEIQAERERQDDRWGVQHHGPMVWLGILAEEFGEVAREANDLHFPMPGKGTPNEIAARYRKELIQTAAVAVAMVECLDREGVMGRQP